MEPLASYLLKGQVHEIFEFAEGFGIRGFQKIQIDQCKGVMELESDL